MKAVVFFIGFLLFGLIMPKKVFAVSLFSSDFENQNISAWSSSGGGASATISSELSKSGNYSLKIQHDKTSSYGYQILISNIEGGMFYQAQAFGKSGDISTDSFFIRVAWYSSSDGSGSQLSTPSDSNLVTVSNDWAELKTSVIQAPSLANSAKFRLVLTSKSQGTLASAFFDNVSFEEAIAPTSTLAPTQVSANTPNPTTKPTSTLTPLPTPSKTPTPTKSLATIVSPTRTTPTAYSTPALDQSILGDMDKSDKDKGVVTYVEGASSSNKIGVIFIALGVLFLSLCGMVFFWSYKNSKNNAI